MSEITPSATNFPLRWEFTGDKWWYASPIDCAAANGHYDLVRELIRLDSNHLISLTSLRRLKRLESVWNDDEAAKSRSSVARSLLQDSEIGVSGWLLYTAASGGDLDFVREILDGDPLLVFGEGEYGITEMMYAAARSGSCEVFWLMYDYAASPRFERGRRKGGVPKGFKWEVVNRAVHGAARGGNLVVLMELLGDGDGVLGYRDAYGATVLHAAAGRGQVQVVKYLIVTYEDIVSSTDNKGNTALHVAAYKGQLSVLEALLTASPLSITTTNNTGNTLLHMAVAGALSHGFRRLDRQIELTKQLITRENFYVEDIINAKNNEGRTALHNAIIGNVHSDLVELLMTARYVNVNVRDYHGMTSLDYLRHRHELSSSETLMRQLMSAGGILNCQDYSTRKAMASHLKMQGCICSSPGTSFRVLDSEIFRYSGMEHLLSCSRTGHKEITVNIVSPHTEISQCGSNGTSEEKVGSEKKKRGGPVENAAKKLKTMFQWPKTAKKLGTEAPIPLRERFLGTKTSNKRSLSNVSSPINRKKFASGVVQGAMVNLPHGNAAHGAATSSSFCKTSSSSHSSVSRTNGRDGVGRCSFSVQDECDETPRLMDSKKGTMKQYLCFGGSRLSVKNSVVRRGKKELVQTVACY